MTPEVTATGGAEALKQADETMYGQRENGSLRLLTNMF